MSHIKASLSVLGVVGSSSRVSSLKTKWTDVTCNFPSVPHLRIQAQLLGEEHTAAEIKVCTCCFSLKNRAIFNKDREWLLRIICNKMITALCVPRFQNKKKSKYPFLHQSRGNVPNGQCRMKPFSRLSSELCLKDTFHVCLSEPTVSIPRQVMEEQKELQQWSNPVLLPSSSTMNSEKERELQCNGPWLSDNFMLEPVAGCYSPGIKKNLRDKYLSLVMGMPGLACFSLYKAHTTAQEIHLWADQGIGSW